MSEFVYNNVSLPYIRTKGIDYDLVMDDSGVDPLWTKISLHSQSLLNRSVLGMSPAAWIQQNIAALQAPRKALSYRVNADTLITSDADQDVHNGPIPKPLQIQEIVADQSMLITFTVETYLHQCVGGARSDILSHRWRESVSYDERSFATWTRAGKVVVRGGFQPDVRRPDFYPDVQRGMKRIKHEWTIAEDGQSYGYIIQDQEKYLLPPGGAFKASGEYIESSSNMAQRFGECRVRLEGDKNTSKPDLIALAVRICLDKLKPPGRKIWPIAAAVKEDLYDNIVEASVKVRWAAADGQIAQGIAITGSALGRLPYGSTSQTTANDAGPYGSARIQILRARIEDWCTNPAITNAIGQVGTAPGGNAGQGATISVGPVPDVGGGGDFGEKETDPPYTEYTVYKNYVDDKNVIQMPLAGDVDGESVIVQVAAPTKRLIVSWNIERIGGQPEVPSTEPANANAVLTNVQWEPRETVPTADGTSFRYAISGSCTYVFKTNNQVTISAALPPWVKGGAAGVVTYKVSGKGGIIGKEA